MPPTAPVAGGIGSAEARSSGRHYRHDRSLRRLSVRRGRRVAVAVDLPPGRDLHLSTTAAAEPPDGPDDARLRTLRQALVEKASALAEPQPRPAAPTAGPAPRSVLFDFEAGLKTTLFEDGASVREPFDVALARRLAAPPPAPKAVAVPSS